MFLGFISFPPGKYVVVKVSCYFLDRRWQTSLIIIKNRCVEKLSQVDELMSFCQGLSPAVAIIEFPFTEYDFFS